MTGVAAGRELLVREHNSCRAKEGLRSPPRFYKAHGVSGFSLHCSRHRSRTAGLRASSSYATLARASSIPRAFNFFHFISFHDILFILFLIFKLTFPYAQPLHRSQAGPPTETYVPRNHMCSPTGVQEGRRRTLTNLPAFILPMLFLPTQARFCHTDAQNPQQYSGRAFRISFGAAAILTSHTVTCMLAFLCMRPHILPRNTRARTHRHAQVRACARMLTRRRGEERRRPTHHFVNKA